MTASVDRRYKLREFGLIDVGVIVLAVGIATAIAILRESASLAEFAIIATVVAVVFLPRLLWSRSLNYAMFESGALHVSTLRRGPGIVGVVLNFLPLRDVKEVRLPEITSASADRGTIRITYVEGTNRELRPDVWLEFRPVDVEAFVSDLQSRIRLQVRHE